MSVVQRRRKRGKFTLELERSDDVDLHDGLEHDGVTLGERLLERALSCESESELGGVDLMSGSILEHELAAADGVAGEDASLESVVESLRGCRVSLELNVGATEKRGRTFITAGMNAAGMLPPMTWLSNASQTSLVMP